ncbi:MAG TPA: nuclear transport factor 2 family protein [Thermoanaerobaculia bacterium]|nr:nuclear transport factor 2 family protein [Thermoanaerobaculia bacterium]
MKIGRWMWTFSLAALLGAPALFAAAPSGASVVEGEWLRAMKANDLEAIVACYAPDAILWAPGRAEARGTNAIREAYRGYLTESVVKDVSLAHVDHRDAAGFSAGWGEFTLTLAPKAGGDPIVMRGRFTEVVEKLGGKWLYVADHASADPAPAPAPASK